jgi:YYY domain-containing protein
MNWIDDIARWYIVSLAAGLAAAPLSAWLFRRLPGYGAFFARPIGLLAIIWPLWLLASISPIPYSNLTLILTALAVATICWGLAWRGKTISRDWVRPYAAAEATWIVAFLAYLWFRGYVPKIAATEKPMDSAFLSSTMRTTDMPPADPWYSGETINYYYLGYLYNGTIGRLAGLDSWIVFNLALANVFALTITTSAGLAWGLIRKWFSQGLAVFAGAAAAFLLVVAGNLRAPIQFLQDPHLAWTDFWYYGPGWTSSRVVVDTGQALNGETINEFPSFSFVLGDLHPHLTTLPFTVVVLALAVSLFLRVRDIEWNAFEWRHWSEFVAIGVVLGSLYPMNSWDFPTYGVAVAVALLFSTGINRTWLIQMAGIGIVAILAWSPFWVSFVPFAGGNVQNPTSIPGLRFIQQNVAFYTGERTSTGEFLTVFGVFWAISLLWLFVETLATWPKREPDEEQPVRPAWFRGTIIASILIVAMIALSLPAPVILLSGALVLMAGRLIYRGWGQPASLETLIAILFAAGWFITIGTEFFYIRDVFGSRFNTLFKIYYQVWTMVAIASALGLAHLFWRASRVEASAKQRQGALAIGATAVLLVGIVYPIISMKTYAELGYIGSTGWMGLDGLAPHGTGGFVLDPANPTVNTGKSAADVAAIRWLNGNARADDVLLEGAGCGYTINGELPTSRFSAFTGIPTIIGWKNSEDQWRNGQTDLNNQIVPRQSDVAAMFEDPNPATNPLFDQYGVTLLIIGDLEKYGAGMRGADDPVCDVAGPFDSINVGGYPGPGWTLMYEGDGDRIYRRDGT